MAENKTNTAIEKKAEGNKPAVKKENWFVRTGKAVTKWVHELRVELKKVVWPSRKDVVRNTIVVLACVLAVGVCIWVFDWLSAAVVRALINLFQG